MKFEPHGCRDCYEINPGFAVSDEGQKRCLMCNGVVLSVTEMIDYIAWLRARENLEYSWKDDPDEVV